MAVLGTLLLVVPNFLLGLFLFPGTTEVWIRVVGVVVLVLAFYDIQAGRKEITEYFKASVPIRVTPIIFFTIFVLLGFTRPQLILFGVVDLLGAIWTALTLRPPKTAR
jgi:hypothetical protein